MPNRARRLFPSALSLAALAAATSAQQGPPPKVQWFPAAAAAEGKAWQPLCDRATLTIGRYRLETGAKDGQQPHDRDEVYCVLSGKAKLTAAGETRDVGPGDCVFVAAHAAHHFHDIAEALDLVVFFSSARAGTGGMIEGPKPTEQTPYPETSPRAATRIFYWFGPDSAGQLAIEHGQPRWHPRFERFLAAPGLPRWRCGENFWTTLDTNMPLVLGGVDVPVGNYYVVLQHGEKGMELVLLDPVAIRERRLDAYEAPKTTGGIVVPMQKAAAAVPSARLSMELTVDRTQKDHGRLALRFGPHELGCDVVMKPAR